MMEIRLQQQAAMRAAELLHDLLVRFGANAADIIIASEANGAKVTSRRSAGAAAEFGDLHHPALRRLGRAVEALSRGDIL
jgi:hypothetical protein